MQQILSCSCFLVLVLPYPCGSAPTSIPDVERAPAPQNDLELATDYLHLYYDLKKGPSSRRKRSWPLFASKVRDMQSFFGLNSTGSLDAETIEVMRAPRCGVPDVEDYSHDRGTHWNKSVITYSIGRYTRDLPRSTVDLQIESALAVWARASSLIFVRSQTRTADIMVEFVSYEHGDFYPFDGPKGTLAHAFGPGEGNGGDTHFDDDELWTVGSNGFNLFLVAAHEFGHALGLKHSRNPESVMYPTYKARSPMNTLSREDVININMLYAPKRGLQQPYSRPGWSPLYNPFFSGLHYPLLIQNKCAPDLSFDAVSPLGDSTLFFKDRYLWIKHNEQHDIKEGPINNFMPKIETSIDAIYWVPRRSVAYLIHESTYWTVKGTLVKGKPKPLIDFGLPPMMQSIDATVHVASTRRTLFFTRDVYWSYNENQRVMDVGYPRYVIEDFPGLNSTISAAVHRDGFIYFFVGPQVLKYDYTQRQVVGVDKSNSWLGC